MEKKFNTTPETAVIDETTLYHNVDGEEITMSYLDFNVRNKAQKLKIGFKLKDNETTGERYGNQLKNLATNLYARAYTDIDRNILIGGRIAKNIDDMLKTRIS